MEFKDILRELRKEKQLSQRKLASMLNVTDSAVRCWERFGREPNFSTLIKLAEIFEVSADYLLGIEK